MNTTQEQAEISQYRAELAQYRAMVEFLDIDFDFSEASQDEYDEMAAEAIDAGFFADQFQTAVDPTGTFPVIHIIDVGDATPICGKGNLVLTEWSESRNSHEMGRSLVAPDHAVCGACGDEFWEAQT